MLFLKKKILQMRNKYICGPKIRENIRKTSRKKQGREEKKGADVNSNKIAHRQLIHLLRGGKSENLYQTQRQKETRRQRARAILFFILYPPIIIVLDFGEKV